MIPLLTAQQITHFAKNRFLEFEDVFSLAECAQYQEAIRKTLQKRPSDIAWRSRDLWRDAPQLKSLILSRKCTTIASSLQSHTPLCIGCDQWFDARFQLQKPTPIKDFFSIQGIELIFLISPEAPPPHMTSKIGLFPFPRAAENLLIVHPQLLLNLPACEHHGLYAIVYAKTPSVYVQNPSDPAGLWLKQFGYHYGDTLRHDTNPRLSFFN